MNVMRYRWALLALALLLPMSALVAAGMGAYPIPTWQVPRAVLEGGPAADVLRVVRFPRVALAGLVGAALALGGAVLQGLFRNPLADPGLLGVSAGGSLGAAVTIILLPTPVLGVWTLPLAAFMGGIMATALVWKIAEHNGRISTTALLLAGIAINSLAGAGIGLLLFLADDQQLRTLTFWTLGGLGGASWKVVLATLPLIVLGSIVLLRLTRMLNALALGESDAFHLGVPVQVVKYSAIAGVAMVVGAAVAAAGGIGFIGLIVPHLFRLFAGPDHRFLLPGSMLGGALLLIAADLSARTIAAPAELPVGVCTALLGGPFFLWLLLRFRRETALA